jgi:outer membrane protein TolC
MMNLPARMLATLALILVTFPAHARGGATRLSLDEAIRLALSRDVDVDRADRSSKIARLQIANARANYLPAASVNVAVNQSATGSTYRTQDVTFRRGLAGNFVGTVNANVSMPIDISGSIGRQVDSAQLANQLAELGLDRARRDALIDVQSAYLSALQAQQMVRIDETIVGSIESLRTRAAKRLPTMLPYFEVELANAREMLRLSRAADDQAQDGLKLALRLPFEQDLDLTSPLPDYERIDRPDGRETASVDVESAELRLKSAELGIERAKDVRRPSLRVGAYATQTFSGAFIDDAGRTTNRDYGLNIALNLPLFNYDAGRSENSVRTSQLLAEQARIDLDTTRRTTELGVRQARQALQRAEKRLAQLPDPKAAADALGNATKALFAADPATAPALLAQVSNARLSWRSAQASVMDAKVGALVAALRLSKALDRPLILGTIGASFSDRRLGRPDGSTLN